MYFFQNFCINFFFEVVFWPLIFKLYYLKNLNFDFSLFFIYVLIYYLSSENNPVSGILFWKAERS